VPIVLAPAGSAKPPAVAAFTICVQDTAGSPSCTGTAKSSFAGNTQSTIQLSVINSNSSTVSLASADIVVPDQLKVEQGTAAPSKYVSTSGQHILFSGINLPKGKSFTATFAADVACGGTFDWSMSQVATDGSGTSFTYTATPTTTTTIQTACHLAFVAQPTDTKTGDTIVNRLPQADQSVTVGLFDNDGNPLGSCPVGYGTDCKVNVASIQPGVTGTTTRSLAGGGPLASFDDLTITNTALATQYNLTATGVGGFAPTVESASFLIAKDVTPATCSQGNCSKNQQRLDGDNLTPSFVDVQGVTNFNFMTLAPFTFGAVPDGCTGRKDLGVAGFAESDGRSGTVSTLTINFYVNMDNLKANYGANTGQQFVPICVGARPVDSNGVAHDCDDASFPSTPWTGDEINKTTGKFTGKTAPAVCNADGYYWGIIGSYQDKLPGSNPIVTSWNGQNIGGQNYRDFVMSVPPGWDYRGGP
jgi:hypothetical protein